jgi:hypothetical protein
MTMKKATVTNVMKMLLALLAAAMMPGEIAAAQNATIAGTILGGDEAPLVMANVSLFRPNGMRPVATVAADFTGRYSIATAERGFLVLRYSGVGHRSFEVGVLLDDTVNSTVDVRLEPHEYRKSFDSIRVIGDFNGFVHDAAVTMVREDDGCYYAQFPSTSKIVHYQLIGISKDGPVSAPSCMAYEFDGTGDYHSVAMPSKGVVTLKFDSTLMPAAIKAKAKAKATFDNPKMEEVARVYGDILRRRDAFRKGLVANREAGRNLNQFKYNWSRDLTWVSRLLAEEKDTLIRGMIYVSLLDLGTLGASSNVNEASAKAALATIPPTSPLWSINPKLLPLAIERTEESDSVYQDYVRQAILGHADPEVTSLLLYDGLTVAYTAKQTDKAQEYYTRLTTEYSSSRYAAMARAQFTMATKNH